MFSFFLFFEPRVFYSVVTFMHWQHSRFVSLPPASLSLLPSHLLVCSVALGLSPSLFWVLSHILTFLFCLSCFHSISHSCPHPPTHSLPFVSPKFPFLLFYSFFLVTWVCVQVFSLPLPSTLILCPSLPSFLLFFPFFYSVPLYYSTVPLRFFLSLPSLNLFSCSFVFFCFSGSLSFFHRFLFPENSLSCAVSLVLSLSHSHPPSYMNCLLYLFYS